MKKKLISTIFILLIILFTTNIVQATNKLNLEITLPEDIKQNNMADAKMKEYYEQNHIYLHATNEKQDESVMVIQLENELTKRVGSLKGLSEQNRNMFLEEYNQVKLQDGQSVLRQEIYEKEDMLFIDTVYEKTANEKTIQTEEYYTIFKEKALIVSASSLNKDIDSAKARQMMESIKVSVEEDNSGLKDMMYVFVIPVMIIVLGVIYVIKEKRNKVQLEENEKNAILHNVTKYLETVIDYSKFRGILILFGVTIGLNILNLLFGVIGQITSDWMEQELLFTKIYMILAMLQNMIQLIGVIYIAYRLTKKEVKTIKKIQNTFVSMLIGVMLLTISRVIIQFATIGMNQNFISYITYETGVFTKSMIYILIWYFYFRNSIRVSVYYQEKSLEQMITNPKKGYQNNFVNKRIMEFKIIEYFKSQKAYDYASGIYINKLPKEYKNSLSLSDLNTKKVIRLKRAKYYLSKKDLESPKAEKRKTIKTVLGIITIYLFVELILYIL